MDCWKCCGELLHITVLNKLSFLGDCFSNVFTFKEHLHHISPFLGLLCSQAFMAHIVKGGTGFLEGFSAELRRVCVGRRAGGPDQGGSWGAL